MEDYLIERIERNIAGSIEKLVLTLIRVNKSCSYLPPVEDFHHDDHDEAEIEIGRVVSPA